MKKICYVISTLKKTGPVNVLYNLVKNLDRTQFEPCIITLSKEPQNSLFEDFKKLGINILSLNINRVFSFFYAPIKLKKLINKVEPDIVHTQCFRSSLFSAISLDKYKKIATIHCDYKTDFKMSYGRWVGYIMYLLMNYSLKKIKNNICVSKQLADILNEQNSHIEFNYIDNGIDTEIFKPIENKVALRKKLNLPINKTIFIWSGVFIERKDPMTLIRVIKQINDKNLFFVFCGNGFLDNMCKKELKNNNKVLFTGFVNNIQQYLQASDYYISTSLSEGLPMNVLEAFSCGLPCILSNIPQHKYILGKKEDVGIFFESQDTQDLKIKISKVLNIDYKLYSEKAVNLIKNKFSAKLMSEKYQKFYE